MNDTDTKSEAKWPKRVWCSHIPPHGVCWSFSLPDENGPPNPVCYILETEHLHILKEREAQVWEDAHNIAIKSLGINFGFYDKASAIRAELAAKKEE